MSTFGASYDSVERFDVPVLSEEFKKRFPLMAEAFSGEMGTGENAARFKRAPASITLFFEVARFKFVVSPRHSSKVAFGSGTDGVGGFSEIEQALALGHFEWKLRSGQKRS